MPETILKVLAGIGGGIISFLFGEWTQLLTFFFFSMVLDYISGVFASRRQGIKLSSKIGFRGIGKKLFIWLLVALAHQADLTLSTGFIMSGFVYFFIANELISIKENYEKMNITLPTSYQRIIDYFKKKDESTTLESNDGK